MQQNPQSTNAARTPRCNCRTVDSADCTALLSSVGTKIVFIEIVASYGFSPQADRRILPHRVKAGRSDQIADITRSCCDAAIDRHLFGHVLPNFRKQLPRAVRLRHMQWQASSLVLAFLPATLCVGIRKPVRIIETAA
jgi:hypothetical protein